MYMHNVLHLLHSVFDCPMKPFKYYTMSCQLAYSILKLSLRHYSSRRIDSRNMLLFSGSFLMDGQTVQALCSASIAILMVDNEYLYEDHTYSVSDNHVNIPM